MWHCPHCGAPQAETARCWVCRRSSTTCSTCRHFRTSLAADVGYCAKDRWRTPLTGLELRACWEQGRRAAPALPVGPGAPHAADDQPGALTAGGEGRGPLDRPNPMRLRGFVPVEELAAAAAQSDDAGTREAASGPRPTRLGHVKAPAGPLRPDTIEDWEKRVSLFGDAEG